PPRRRVIPELEPLRASLLDERRDVNGEIHGLGIVDDEAVLVALRPPVLAPDLAPRRIPPGPAPGEVLVPLEKEGHPVAVAVRAADELSGRRRVRCGRAHFLSGGGGRLFDRGRRRSEGGRRAGGRDGGGARGGAGRETAQREGGDDEGEGAIERAHAGR